MHAIRAAQHVELSMGRDNIATGDGVLLGSLPGSNCNMPCCLSLSLLSGCSCVRYLLLPRKGC